MSQTHLHRSTPPADDSTGSTFAPLADLLFAAQRELWEACFTWQQSLVTLNQDLWEQWAAHFAGGVPIDG
jgi:hypothetical protein